MRDIRLAAGVSQEELARRSHLRRTFVSRIERGIANPSLATIALIVSGLEACGRDSDVPTLP
jgi:transcriptional regulator with XRE-family HTH domain